ncbi:hypothetical protein [Cyclobacterium plantarum]|uniref:DUF4221 domain-containing protein n=1 Tax=Cyclobacterium plantarum TaxID=2716263 RepID=A0ABX0HFC7_9BACT|nr:hypothetical protein [Cyclobacterium plantarum]NHE58882.1 hypothetical protein [Cyclobacterium plantarum]
MLKKKHITGVFIIMAMPVLISCNTSSKSEEEMGIGTTYYLEKVDSIRIARENRVTILDYHPIEDRFLAYDQITEEFLVLDGKGELLEAVYRIGEGPNEYNSSLLAASFNQEAGGYFLQSSGEFLWYNPDWEVEERARFTPSVFIRFYSGPRFKVPYFRFEDELKPYFFTNFFSGVNNAVRGMNEGNASDNLIEFYNSNKESLEWGLAKDPGSLPQIMEDPGTDQEKPTQVFALDRAANRLYLTYDRSNTIGVYDMDQDFGLQEMLHFEHRRFSAINNAKNKALFNFEDDLVGVLYFEGLSEAATGARKANDPEYFPFKDPGLYHFILLQDGVQQKEEIVFPAGCGPHSEVLSLPGKRFLLRDKYRGEDEPTYSTYSVYELKSDI